MYACGEGVPAVSDEIFWLAFDLLFGLFEEVVAVACESVHAYLRCYEVFGFFVHDVPEPLPFAVGLYFHFIMIPYL